MRATTRIHYTIERKMINRKLRWAVGVQSYRDFEVLLNSQGEPRYGETEPEAEQLRARLEHATNTEAARERAAQSLSHVLRVWKEEVGQTGLVTDRCLGPLFCTSEQQARQTIMTLLCTDPSVSKIEYFQKDFERDIYQERFTRGEVYLKNAP